MPENLRVIRTRKNDKLIAVLCNDDRYIIHKTGKIESMIQRSGKLSADRTFREIKPYPSSNGYFRMKYDYVDLWVHRIVYQKHIGDLDANMVINHLDGNPSNNDVSNLEQTTHQGNMIHAVQVLKKKPVLGATKINFLVAERIRDEHKMGLTQKRLAEKYGLSTVSINQIIHFKTWKPGVVYQNG